MTEAPSQPRRPDLDELRRIARGNNLASAVDLVLVSLATFMQFGGVLVAISIPPTHFNIALAVAAPFVTLALAIGIFLFGARSIGRSQQPRLTIEAVLITWIVLNAAAYALIYLTR